METGTDVTASRARLWALRIVGWLLGVLTIGYSIFFVILSLLADDPADVSHRFHFLAILAGGGLIGVFSIMWVMRPDRTASFHALVAQALAWLIGGLMGGDLFTGLYISGVVGLAILWILHPNRRSVLRLPGRPSIALMTYGLLGMIPAWIYAVSQSDLQHGPASDPHVEFHHWSGIGVAALSIAGAGIASSLRGKGWQTVATWTAVAAVLFGFAGLVFSDLPGAPDQVWSWVAVAAGIGFWLLARVEAAREAPSG